jgi:PAS domain S-box-containing protein
MEREIRILFLEDRPEHTELAQRELRRAGLSFDARRAGTKEAFLAELADFKPELIISDDRLPSFDALSALALARQHLPELPFILVSGHIGEELTAEALQRGVTDFLLKDNIATRLAPAVRRAMREVEDRRLAQAALRQNEESFHNLFIEAPVPKWVFSVATQRFLEVNETAIATYGYSRDEFLSMTLKDIRAPADIVRLEQSPPPLPTADRPYVGARRHRHKDGRTLDVEVYSRPIQFQGEAARLSVIIDVTAHKQAERRIERIFETSEDLILATDGFGKITQVSPSSAKMLGYPPEQMIGRSAADFILPEDLEQTRDEMKAARRGSATRNFRSRYIHKDGHQVSLAWTGVWSEADHQHFFIGRDMTDYDRTEAQLRQAQKMEVVGQLTGGVAHDFNNILMVVMANLDSLEEEQGLGPVIGGRVSEIGEAVQRAADLTQQLLAFSRKQPLRPRPTDVNELVAGTGNLLRRALGEHIEIDSVLADDLWAVDIDRAQLGTALINLCVNARDAMPEGGRLLIETRNATLDENDVADLPGVVVGDYALLVVSDTGIGIAAENLTKVFEPFFTTKDVGKGSGLGLSMVYGFVKQSNGHVAIESEFGRGTSIKLFLPRSSRRAEVTSLGQPASMLRGNERILIVEDDAQVRASVAGQLRSLGYIVAEAPDGAAGVAAFQAASPPYDLLLTDVVMPGALDGKALADEVARRWPTTKIVFMSGYIESDATQHGRLGAEARLLNKPFRKADLANILREALDAA